MSSLALPARSLIRMFESRPCARLFGSKCGQCSFSNTFRHLLLVDLVASHLHEAMQDFVLYRIAVRLPGIFPKRTGRLGPVHVHLSEVQVEEV